MRIGLLLSFSVLMAYGLLRSARCETSEVFVPIGDSYTIGEGVAENERWPNQLVEKLAARGIAIRLAANPARTGWTTSDAIDREVPVLEKEHPTFVTLQIGVNDWVQGSSKDDFRARFVELVTILQSKLPNPRRLVVVTIPDFSVTPTGKTFSRGRDISAGLREFNDIIVQEAGKRGIPVADIWGASLAASGDATMLVSDRLHPSGKQYSRWVDIIEPVVVGALAAAGK